jgi:hypothetical protein
LVSNQIGLIRATGMIGRSVVMSTPITSVTFLAQDRRCNREPKRFLRENYDGVKMADGRWRTIGVTSTYEAGSGLRAFRLVVVFCAGLVVLAHFSASVQVLSIVENAGTFLLWYDMAA